MSATRTTVFTGWHMLAIMLAFFGTIISVNVLMAYLASSSWSGMLAKNTYVASQDFNKKAAQAREWASLGLEGHIAIGDGAVRYRLVGPPDMIATINHVEAIFHRPVGDKQDFSVKLIRDGDAFAAEAALAAGPWIVDLAAMRSDEVLFHQAERIVSEGR